MRNKVILVLIILIASFLRFFNLMHDAPYFFNPDERNMANAITQLRLPAKLTEIPSCLVNQFSQNPTTEDLRQMANCNLNPHFFSYGQFPLYLAFTSDQIMKPFSSLFLNPLIPNDQSLMTNFLSAIFWLRFWSALSSTLTVLLVFLISQKLLTTYYPARNATHSVTGGSLLATLFAAFTPGLIQSAHFGTTESLLTFFFLLSIYVSSSYLSNLSNLKFIIVSSIAIGLSLGSKLTGIFFFLPPIIALMIRIIALFKGRKKKLFIGLFENLRIAYLPARQGLFLIIGSIFFFIISSPYNLVEPADFKSAVFGYESDVATGKYGAFYTRQFVNTTPILFQAEKIFPYALGWPVFGLGTVGLLIIMLNLILYSIKRSRGKMKQFSNATMIQKNHWNILTLLIVSFLIYLLPNASLFAKWTRFMTPVLPFFSIFAGYLLSVILGNISDSRMTTKFAYLLICILVLISLLPGIAFPSIYYNEDTRLQASKWIYNHIPQNSYILSETANVVDIPLGLPDNINTASKNYEVISFNFYDLDENASALFPQLLTHLEKANYIFIPSRRIFANLPKISTKFPLVTKYYQLLFSGALGFEKVSEINSFPALDKWRFPDEEAEETFTVFDHPVIRIYQKVHQYSQDQYRALFTTARID